MRPESAGVTKGPEIRHVTKQSPDTAGEMMNLDGLIADDVFAELLPPECAADTPLILGLRQKDRHELPVSRQSRFMPFAFPSQRRPL